MADQLAGLATLLQTLGGNKTSTSPGDTGALTNVLGQLQGADYSKLLAGIFQQAGAEIPKLQVGLGNAMGARSGNNSAVAAALQALMQQTALAGQKQIADQQLQNQQLQVQAGQGVAQATRGTTVQSGTNLTRAAGILAALSGLKKAGKEFGAAGGLGGLLGGSSDVSSAPAPITGAAPATLSPVSGGTVETGAAPALGFSALTNLFSDSPADSGASNSVADLFPVPSTSVESTPLAPLDPPADTPISDANFGDEWLSSLLGFADGGLVGRDGTRPGKVRGYAAGGVVRAAGSRRSSNPDVQQDSIDKMQANPAGMDLSNPTANMQLVDMINAVTGAAPLRQPSSSAGTARGAGAGESVNPNIGAGLSGASALDTLSGLTGGPTLGDSTGLGMGTLAGLANARGAADVLSQFGQLAASMISPTLGAATATGTAALMDDPGRAANILAGLANPALGTVNVLSSLFGGPTVGGLLMGTPAVTPQGAGPVTEATPGLLGAMGLTSGGGSWHGNTAATTSPVTSYGNITSTSLGSLGSSDSGDSGDSTSSPSSSSSAGMANGGKVKGPGTGTSDSIPAMLSKGEYVMPADVVSKLGPDFFDMLNKALHTPTGA